MNPNFAALDSYQVTIALATTPQPAVAPSGDVWKYATEVVIQCPATNTSDIVVGGPSRQAFIVAKGTSLALSSVLNRQSQSAKFDLTQIYIKAGTNSDKANILLVQPEKKMTAVEV